MPLLTPPQTATKHRELRAGTRPPGTIRIPRRPKPVPRPSPDRSECELCETFRGEPVWEGGETRGRNDREMLEIFLFKGHNGHIMNYFVW